MANLNNTTETYINAIGYSPSNFPYKYRSYSATPLTRITADALLAAQAARAKALKFYEDKMTNSGLSAELTLTPKELSHYNQLRAQKYMQQQLRKATGFPSQQLKVSELGQRIQNTKNNLMVQQVIQAKILELYNHARDTNPSPTAFFSEDAQEKEFNKISNLANDTAQELEANKPVEAKKLHDKYLEVFGTNNLPVERYPNLQLKNFNASVRERLGLEVGSATNPTVNQPTVSTLLEPSA